MPVALNLQQDGSSISGTMETMLGNGIITGGSVRGSTVSATANTEIQGQSAEFLISGSLENEALSGTISAAIIPDSLTFTGKRST